MVLPTLSRLAKFFLTCVAVAALPAPLSLIAQDHASYRYFRIGNPEDKATTMRPGFALMGGGKDLDAAFRWMCERSGGGDFLILRATGDDDYNPYVNKLCHLNSVATLVIPDKAAADDPFVSKAIANAAAIFISGGDQAHYINAWRDAPVQTRLNEAVKRGVPIGGTSAGLAVQGEYIYSAQNDLPDGPDLTSKLALDDPFCRQVVIVRGFLNNPEVHDTIFDTHFDTRNRMGRLLAFMARIRATSSASVIRGIGVDERTAFLMDADGKGTVVGAGSVYFLSLSIPAQTLAKGHPLTLDSVDVRRVAHGGRFDVHTWTGESVDYQLRVTGGIVLSTQHGGAVY